MSTTTPYIEQTRALDYRSINYTLQPPLNPHLILHFDIVRNTQTLHFQIKTSQPPSLDRAFARTMRGYSGIMSSSDCSCDFNGNGEKVHIPTKHSLWEPKNTEPTQEPLWHLRVQVLKDQEGRADAPGRRYQFKSKHHLTFAANQLEAAFGDAFDMRKCGVETPDAMGGRVNDGRCANVTIEYESETAKTNWSEFLAKLKALEDEWDHEGHLETPSVL